MNKHNLIHLLKHAKNHIVQQQRTIEALSVKANAYDILAASVQLGTRPERTQACYGEPNVAWDLDEAVYGLERELEAKESETQQADAQFTQQPFDAAFDQADQKLVPDKPDAVMPDDKPQAVVEPAPETKRFTALHRPAMPSATDILDMTRDQAVTAVMAATRPRTDDIEG